jgi:transcriptional regulator with XRE-family HTH domain
MGGHTPHTPCVERLMRQVELRAHDRSANGVDQSAVFMLGEGHASLYQRTVETSSASSLIANTHVANLLLARMALSDRIRAAYQAKGFKSARAAAIACGWDAQRFDNYLKGRVPDVESLMRMSEVFGTTPNDLLGISEQSDSELLDILRRLLELEGLPAPRAGMIAEVAQASLRQLQHHPGDRSPELPAVIAQTIWIERSESGNGKSPRP